MVKMLKKTKIKREGETMDNKYKILITSLLLIIIIALVLVISLSKPNEKTIINILVEDGITINGSDSNIIHPYTNCPPDHVSVVIPEEDISKFEIIESCYDFINRKYFCIFEFNAYSRDQYFITARALMFLHYDKGWKLSAEIGVIDSNCEIDEHK